MHGRSVSCQMLRNLQTTKVSRSGVASHAYVKQGVNGFRNELPDSR